MDIGLKSARKVPGTLLHYLTVILLRPWQPLIFVSLGVVSSIAIAAPITLRPDITVSKVLDTASMPASPSVRLARLSRPNTAYLYYLKLNGDIYQVNVRTGTQLRLYTAAQHHVASAEGFAIGPTGVFYVVGNENVPNSSLTIAKIVKGVFKPALKVVEWSVLAQTVPYPRSTTFDHNFNAVVAAPAGDFIYVNSGARTDHGEIQTAKGMFPNTREVGLTACILRLPANGTNIVLPNNRPLLKASGYIFAEGVRNTFDLAFGANGDLFGTENGPDRDMSDELNWLQLGRHYGFPWRFGRDANPQQFANYNPALDRLLDKRFFAVKGGYYKNDPTFPKRPSITFTDPVVNLGPDADSYRDTVDGKVKDASQLGLSVSTFTAHRSPLGLVFNRGMALSPEFKGDGFMVSWTRGDAKGNSVVGPFLDASQDLLNLDLTKNGQVNYTLKAKRLVAGFNNPIDAELIANNIYVLEYGGKQTLWKISLPIK